MAARAVPMLLTMAVVLAASTAAHAQDAATTLHQLLLQYRCPIVDRLQRIYAEGDPEQHPDEYLIVDLPPFPEHYVQCLFYKRGRIYCEAASGFFLNAPGEPRTMYLPAAAIAALARLGFSTDDSKGNFSIDFEVTDPPDFGAIADLMLKALHDGFGARATTTLRFDAPYAPHGTSKCAPVS